MVFDRSNLLAAAVWLGLPIAALGLWHVLDRPIEIVHVGSELTEAEREAVVGAVRKTIDGGILSTDIDDVASALRSLTWPRTAEVRRVWPDKLEVDVTKVNVIARWQTDSYLTSTGSVVKVPVEVTNLPLLDCAIATPAEAMEMYGTLRDIATGEALVLTELDQNRIGEWQIRFANQLTVNLGAEKVVERMHRFAHTYRYSASLGTGTLAHVDTRYPNGVALRFNELLADGATVNN